MKRRYRRTVRGGNQLGRNRIATLWARFPSQNRREALVLYFSPSTSTIRWSSEGPWDAGSTSVAAANLEAVSDEVVQIVRILDGFNRHRFTAQPDLLAAWTAASNVVGPPRTGGQPDGGTGGQSDSRSGGQIEPAA